ncbi:putative metal-dependent hydrolase [candidate division KSB1 bacterium]|nr:putative metal-dependent hydrolase [candidate division KSB1 bacterium]
MTDPRYPIGPFSWNGFLTPAERAECIRRILEIPRQLSHVVAQLSPAQLEQSYREGGWSARQLVHHVADSQIVGFIRTKLIVTEDSPTVNPFDENLWSLTADAQCDVRASLAIITGTHERWAALLKSLTAEQFERTWIHPAFPDERRTVDRLVAYFTWHAEHHTAHVRLIANR